MLVVTSNLSIFAVVLTDMGMPYVDGRTVASAIKQTSARTPVIHWGQRFVGDGAPEHVDYVLGKPPKLRELRQALVRAARGEAHRADLQTGSVAPCCW
jgi:CheY-like chemotaxis protein